MPLPLAELRYIFSDYDLATLRLPQLHEYRFHLTETSMRDTKAAAGKVRTALAGLPLSRGQNWVDLRGVYGLSDDGNTINTIGRDFIHYIDTHHPSDFAKEFWLYRALSQASNPITINAHFNRVKNLHILLNSIPHAKGKTIFNNSPTSNKILSLSEHLIPFPKALKKFFSLPNEKIEEFALLTDNEIDTLIASLGPTEQGLDPVLRRIKGYKSRSIERRIYFPASMMILPTVMRVELTGIGPLRIYYPYSYFFTYDQFINYLNQVGIYNVHNY
ncbi:hypothetical protein [Neobacillus soli]|uniref:hypothetical protein n=1 Tax=Neobacillus soli TaxID=220688 RepID=UPI0008262F2F|nr:hypothetical protein [Neobacillus soli]